MSVDVTVCGASSSTSLLRRHIIMLIKICACYLGHKTKLTYHHNTPRSGFKPYIWINAVNAPAPSNILTRFFDGKSFSLYRFGSMEKENQRNQAKKRKKKRINERTNERRKKWEECNRRPTTKTSPVKCTQISFGFSLARTLAPPFISRQISHATFARSTLCSCSTSFCFSCESLSHCDMVSFFFQLYYGTHAQCTSYRRNDIPDFSFLCSNKHFPILLRRPLLSWNVRASCVTVNGECERFPLQFRIWSSFDYSHKQTAFSFIVKLNQNTRHFSVNIFPTNADGRDFRIVVNETLNVFSERTNAIQAVLIGNLNLILVRYWIHIQI